MAVTAALNYIRTNIRTTTFAPTFAPRSPVALGRAGHGVCKVLILYVVATRTRHSHHGGTVDLSAIYKRTHQLLSLKGRGVVRVWPVGM